MEKQLTPFEQQEQNRTLGMKRLAGVLAVHAYLERIKQFKQANQAMTVAERAEWDRIIVLAMKNQLDHFGYEA